MTRLKQVLEKWSKRCCKGGHLRLSARCLQENGEIAKCRQPTKRAHGAGSLHFSPVRFAAERPGPYRKRGLAPTFRRDRRGPLCAARGCRRGQRVHYHAVEALLPPRRLLAENTVNLWWNAANGVLDRLCWPPRCLFTLISTTAPLSQPICFGRRTLGLPISPGSPSCLRWRITPLGRMGVVAGQHGHRDANRESGRSSPNPGSRWHETRPRCRAV